MKKSILITIPTLLLITASAYLVHRHLQTQELEGPEAPEETPIEEILPREEITEENTATCGPTVPESDDGEDPCPLDLNIEMPFYTQAPHSNWDYPWQEACEEASVLLVANLYNNLNLELEPYNTELLRLVDWEIEYFGSYEHTTIEQTAEMLLLQYELESEIHTDPTFEDIQEILNNGHLIIAPFAGKLLDNPNFRNGGPVYHMLVIKGYNASLSQIVTHDVGTRNGENYVYDWSIIENALHDWHDDDILLGEKKLIEVLP